MAENSWWYTPNDEKFDPAAQAQANQKISANIGKSLGSNGPVNSWDMSKAAMTNNPNAPNEYVNTAVLDAVNWLDAKMSVMKKTAVKHDNPMGYVASGQAYRDASSLVGVLRGDEAKKLDVVIKILQTHEAAGQKPVSGNEAGERIWKSAENAKDATYGGFRWGPFTGESRRTKEASAIEYAAAGSEDLLLSLKDDIEKLKRAIQASYMMYLKTGNEAYVTAGGQARRMLADKMGATVENAYKQQMDYYRTILDLSQGADAAVPDSPYVDTARYSVIKKLMQAATDNYKKSIGSSQAGATQSGTTAKDIAEKGKKGGDA